MANLKTIQFLRNASLYESLDAAKSALETKAASCLDGSPLIGRYTVTVSGNTEERSILGLVHVSGSTTGVTFFMNEKEIDNVLKDLDYSGITTSDAAVVTNVTEADGKIAATSANVGNLALTDYVKGSDSGSVAATDSINEAVAKLENQIDAANDVIEALDYNLAADDNKVVVSLNQTDGAVSGTSVNISDIKLAGYEEATAVADVATGDTLGQALGKLQKTIHEMDKAASAEDGKVVTTVSEADGKVSETKANVKDLQLGGYSKDTTKTGAISGTDTVNDALSKLENKAAAITIDNEDGSINVTTGASGTDINVNIKSGEHVIAKTGSAGLYTDIKLSAVTPSSTTVKEEYSLIGTDGTALGTSIKIYKDSSVVKISYITDPSDVHYQNLEYQYIDVSGNTQTEYVDMSTLVLEAEFASGVTADASGMVHGVVDANSEKDESNVAFLTVGTDGFKISGIKDAIDTKINKLDADLSGNTTHVTVGVAEADGKITAVTVAESDIASAQGLADEITARTAADTELSNRLGTGVTTTNTATAQLIALSGDSNSVSGDTSVEGAKRYADAKLSEVVSDLDANISGNSTHVTVGVVEEDGVITAVTVTEDDIANATDLAALSGKAVTAVDMTGGTAAIANAEDGTKKITINTDGSQIFATNYDASSTAPDQQILTGDSINTALAKLYATSKAHHALSSSTVSVSEAANGTTFAVNVDNTTAHAASDDTYASDNQNMIQIKNGGLYVSSSIDCGTF